MIPSHRLLREHQSAYQSVAHRLFHANQLCAPRVCALTSALTALYVATVPLETGVSVRTSLRTRSFAAAPIAGFHGFSCPELGRVLTAAIGGFRRLFQPRCWADRITFSPSNFGLFQSRKPVTARPAPAPQGLHSVCKPIEGTLSFQGNDT